MSHKLSSCNSLIGRKLSLWMTLVDGQHVQTTSSVAINSSSEPEILEALQTIESLVRRTLRHGLAANTFPMFSGGWT